MKRFLLACFLAGAVAACSSGGTSTVKQSPEGLFEFHVDPWISAHHFLYHAARAHSDQKLIARVPLSEKDRALIEGETAQALANAIRAYAPYVDTHLLFDQKTLGISRSLSGGGVNTVEDEAIKAALIRIMPIYLEEFWPHHQETSLRLRRDLMQQLAEFEQPMARSMALALVSRWAAEPIRVDISAYSLREGAYTDNTPPRITMGADDNEIKNGYGLEILFHEAAHTTPLGENLGPMASAAIAKAGLNNSRFWHYALFYIAGTVTCEVSGEENCTPYFIATGLSERKGAKEFYIALDETWDKADTLRDRLEHAALRAAELIAENP